MAEVEDLQDQVAELHQAAAAEATARQQQQDEAQQLQAHLHKVTEAGDVNTPASMQLDWTADHHTVFCFLRQRGEKG